MGLTRKGGFVGRLAGNLLLNKLSDFLFIMVFPANRKLRLKPDAGQQEDFKHKENSHLFLVLQSLATFQERKRPFL